MKRIIAPQSVLIFVCAIVFGFRPNTPIETAKPVSSQSDVAFDKVMSVVTHQRCMNCHPTTDFPRQGDDSHLHQFGVQRGENNQGLAALKCSTCHQTENNKSSGVPGAPHWGLAPISMGWQGLTKYQIAAAMLDRARNGGRSLKDIEEHLTEDELVLWAFEPGVDQHGNERTKPPLSKEEWIASVKTWIASGAKIPVRK
jgi:cytochrome c553